MSGSLVFRENGPKSVGQNPIGELSLGAFVPAVV